MAESRQTNRRDFLVGKSVRAEIARRMDRVAEQTPAISRPPAVVDSSFNRQQAYLEQYAANAMACEFEFSFNLHQYPNASEAAAAGFDLLHRLEQQLSVYRPDSEICQLNRTADQQPCQLELELFRLLQQSLELSRSTRGAFDMTAGPLSQVWGFDQRKGTLPDPAAINEALTRVGWESVRLDESNHSLRFLKPGITLNLGGIGKGYALDRVSREFLGRGIGDFLLHGGQSSLVAIGTSEAGVQKRDEPSAAAGWKIGITHPAMPQVRLGEVVLCDQAMGTSGTAKQGFYHRGKRYGHVIDPRTGWPSSEFLSATVIAPSAAESDALATAFFVMPLEDIERYCADHPGIGAILVSAVNRSTAHTLVTVINVDRFELTERQ
jgi:thiamine biosynthesis lipoprotein